MSDMAERLPRTVKRLTGQCTTGQCTTGQCPNGQCPTGPCNCNCKTPEESGNYTGRRSPPDIESVVRLLGVSGRRLVECDGEWRVLADHARAPTGAGYALENRIGASRVMGTLHSRLNVQRLAPFFAAFREGLSAVCRRSEPRIGC